MKRQRNISRRRFLLSTGAAVALPYLVPSSAVGQAGRAAANTRLALGTIGTGGMGTLDLRGFLACSDVQAVAVCDVDSDRLAKAKDVVDTAYGNKDCAAYKDFREIIGRPDIDLVLIGTPDHWHAIPSIMAAKAGKDVYCEKPMSLTIAEGRAIADTMQRYGTVYQSGTQRRSIDNFRFAVDTARSGKLGALQAIYAQLSAGGTSGVPKPEPVPPGFDYDLWLGPAPYEPYAPARCHGSFRWNYDYSGGGITDLGAHYIDLAQWGNNTEHTGPVEFEGWAQFPKEGIFNTPTNYEVTATYADGVKLHFKPGPWLLKLVGSEGWVQVEENGTVTAEPASILQARTFTRYIWSKMEGHPHIRNFLECVKTRGRTIAPPEVAHRSVTIAHCANICLRLGRKVRWNPEAEQFVNDAEADAMRARAMRPPWHL
jgi:predicted dehydrogenase